MKTAKNYINTYILKIEIFSVNVKNIIRALGTFLKNLRKKRPEIVKGEWFLHWDNAPVHSAKVVQEFLAKKSIKLLSHPPYSPDLAPADYFLFPKLKKELAGFTITQEEFKKEWEGVLGVGSQQGRFLQGLRAVVRAVRKVYSQAISRNRKKINTLLTITLHFLLTLSGIIWISPRTLSN
jgi:transposase